jgi:hypothetical protein
MLELTSLVVVGFKDYKIRAFDDSGYGVYKYSRG